MVADSQLKLAKSLCANAEIPTDYRIEAGELLRRTEDAMIRPPIERRIDNDSAVVEEPVEPLQDLVRRQKERMERIHAVSR
jgi:hypothetical protein